VNKGDHGKSHRVAEQRIRPRLSGR